MLVAQVGYVRFFIVLCIGLLFHSFPLSLYGDESIIRKSNQVAVDASENIRQEMFEDRSCWGSKSKKKYFMYYLFVSDFAASFIEIPTSNVSVGSPTIASSYLAGRAPLYNNLNVKVGTCSASFLSMQNADGIFTDISNYISVDNGLIVTWFTPTTLINLELDTIVHSMVTECIVTSTTKVGFNPFFGDTFDLIVSSDDEKIYFIFSQI